MKNRPGIVLIMPLIIMFVPGIFIMFTSCISSSISAYNEIKNKQHYDKNEVYHNDIVYEITTNTNFYDIPLTYQNYTFYVDLKTFDNRRCSVKVNYDFKVNKDSIICLMHKYNTYDKSDFLNELSHKVIEPSIKHLMLVQFSNITFDEISSERGYYEFSEINRRVTKYLKNKGLISEPLKFSVK